MDRRRPARRLAAVLLVLTAAPPSGGQEVERLVQGPRSPWRVVATEHFRVHYPAPAEAWAQGAAQRLEAIRQRVVAEVGHAPREVVDVVVSDPVAEPNGVALPFLGWPRMVLWTSPPGAGSVIGHYRDWSELLLVHEDTHLVHLLRPSRNPLRRALSRVLPLGPVARAPRWVAEGYATLVEGRLTGAGRPHGDLRAAILRRRAMAGQLPTYGELAADPDEYLGMSMAYLAGSAYLDWLERRAGEGSLRDLWARMTARRARSFEEAFEGVFGESPERLYGRFTAELTWQAMEVERRLDAGEGSGPGAGDVWLDLSWHTGAPAVSPAGDRIALVLGHRDEPSELVVYATAVDEGALAERREERRELREKDPEDIAAVETGPPPHERLHTLPTVDGAAPSEPRWLPDGRSLIVVRTLPDGEGFLHPDLFRWTPEGGRLERLTRGADLRHPDPGPDGSWAVAVRNRHGLSQLVRVDLAGGGVEALTEPSVTVVWDRPRVSPDGAAVAAARHAAGRWSLVVRDLGTGAEEDLPLADGTTVASPAWGRGESAGDLFAVVGDAGFVDVHTWRRGAGGGWIGRRLTRTLGAALAPEPAPDGGVFFLALEPDGLDLRRLEPAPAGAPAPAVDLAGLAPAVRPPTPPPPPPPLRAELPAARPYRVGRQELLALGGGGWAVSGDGGELGVRGGDLLGRLDWVVTGAWGDGAAPEGVAAGAAWRGPTPGPPLDLTLHAFDGRERPSDQGGTIPGLDLLDVDRRGVELGAAWQSRGRPGRLRVGGGGYAGRVEPGAGSAADQRSRRETTLFATTAWSPRWSRGLLAWGLDVEGRLDEGDSGGGSWRRSRAALGLSVGWDDAALRLAAATGSGSGDLPPWQAFQVGGAPSSLLPSAVLAPRFLEPGLPAGTLRGREVTALEADLELDGLPLPLFWARYEVEDGGAPGTLSLAGARWSTTLGPVALVRLPVVHLTLGGAHVLDGPLQGDTNGWLSLTWRP